MAPNEFDVVLQEEVREQAARHLAAGKGHLPIEQRNEQAEKRLADEIMTRAKAGEHFPSSHGRL